MPDKDTELEAYRQTNEALRHYSGLRFTVLGAFIAISGGLFALSVEKLKESGVFPPLALFAMALSVACALVEWRINAVAEFYAGKINSLSRALQMSDAAAARPPKTVFTRWVTPGVMLLIYGGSLAMWLYAWVAVFKPTS
jgi:hypothetical protein